MTHTIFDNVPFNLELAKKITRKEVKGRVVTEDGQEAQIISFENGYTYPIVALIGKEEKERFYCENGNYFGCYESPLDLHIELPTYCEDYSNFKPCKWQPCLVRYRADDFWIVRVCSGERENGEPIFYAALDYNVAYEYVLPLSKVTERLIGTSKSYEELIQELDAE